MSPDSTPPSLRTQRLATRSEMGNSHGDGGTVTIKSADRLDSLTGLRFLAAAMILLHHAEHTFKVYLPSFSLDNGVSLFFVLSGFILAHAYPRLDDWQSVRRFLILRVARIWPAHVATLIAALLLFGGFSGIFFANLLMVQAWIPSAPWYLSYNAVSWSISVEFFFYLAFPLLIWRWNQTLWWKWLGSAAVLAFLVIIATGWALPLYVPEQNVVSTHGLIFISPLARLVEFVTGMVAYSAFAWLRPRCQRHEVASPIGAVTLITAAEFLILALVAYFLAFKPTTGFTHQIGNDAFTEWSLHAGNFAVFVPLLIVLGLGTGGVGRLLSTRIAVVLGEMSYSLYLVHQIVYRIYYLYYERWSAETADPLGFGLCVLISLVIAWLLWRLIEIPCRAWARNRLVSVHTRARISEEYAT
jgi:peptidoglycan/LPS O-acetylase OafA/YrhL